MEDMHGGLAHKAHEIAVSGIVEHAWNMGYARSKLTNNKIDNFNPGLVGSGQLPKLR
jgi:hypothetical protein